MVLPATLKFIGKAIYCQEAFIGDLLIEGTGKVIKIKKKKKTKFGQFEYLKKMKCGTVSF